MAAPNIHQGSPPIVQQGPPIQHQHQHPQMIQNPRQPMMTSDRVRALVMRANALRSNGFTPETSPELDKIMKFLAACQQQQKFQQEQAQAQAHLESHQQAVNGHPPPPTPNLNGVAPPPPHPAALATPSIPAQPMPSNPTVPAPSPVSFTPDQIEALRAQIQAFKLVSRGLPIPEHIQQASRYPSQATSQLEKFAQNNDVNARVVDSAVKVHRSGSIPHMESQSQQPPPPSVHHQPQQPQQPQPQQQRQTTPAVVVDGTGASVKTEELDASVDAGGETPKGPFMEDDPKSGMYPYNAFLHPFSHLKRDPTTNPTLFATRLQRLLVPSIMPIGLDPHQIVAERNRFVDARIEQRIRELEAMPATMGEGGLQPELTDGNEDIKDKKPNLVLAEENSLFPTTNLGRPFVHPSPDTHGKLRALIELKSLRVINKQRAMRAMLAERLTHGSLLPLNRPEFRRVRKPTLRDTRMTEQAERKQRVDRERRAKQKHVEQLKTICDHGQALISANRNAQARIMRLGRSVLSYHSHTEKEEQKRIERISKERLKALKADDEEAYMKLIDTAKDTRITHLLRQTDAYLDSLAQAVMEQQREGGNSSQIPQQFDDDDGPTNEETFGAQKFQDDSATDSTKLDYYAVAHRLKEKVSKQPTILIGGTLKEYQLKGLQWMVSLYNNKLNGILADEMGLGKTIQTISLVTFLIESKRQRGPYLVIVPLSTMTNWSGEFAKWAPSVKMIAYKGNPIQRRALQSEIRTGNFQVLLTTYEYIIKDRPVLSRLKWVHMIIDEGHRMKNTQSKLVQTLTQYYHSQYRLILTGTPLQNNLPELWALLNFVLPKIFNSVKSFDEWFNTPFANSGTGDKIELNEEEALLIIRRLHKVLRPFLLRRLKKDVESELPDKVEKVIKVRMSALQSQLYKQMKQYKMIADGKDSKGKSGGVKGLSNELMQLRKICQHPFLFESVEDKMNPAGIIDEKLIRSSGKIELLSRILPKFFATGHRVLIFFQMTKVMDIMEDFLKMMQWKYLRLDGGTKTEDRAGHVALFNAKDSDIKVFILSTRAGGLGLNLQTADTVIIFDSDWNPHADLQAQDRAHRIGQTKVVRILRFITEKSVEEAMFARARYKLDIDDKVIQAGRFDNKSTQEEQEEFLRSILEADQEEENEEAGDMNDEEINEIISRSDQESIIFRDIDIKRDRDAAENWKAAGNRGKPPPPLIQLEELPDCYRTDEPFVNKDEFEEMEGRGHRRRTVVNYNDGLSDDAWAIALEEGEDIQELSERAREKKERRAANKLQKEVDSRASPALEIDTPRGSGLGSAGGSIIGGIGGGGRDSGRDGGRDGGNGGDRGGDRGGGPGRKGKKGKGKAVEVAFETPLSVKRKRGAAGKSVSVTPSIVDDDDDDRDSKRRKTKGGGGNSDITPAIRDRMKKAMNECYKAVLSCEDASGRKRCELFKEVPDKREYPDYYQLIKQPIALSNLRKRINSNTYKSVLDFREDMRLMFNNARTYNREGSWVYVDAEEMEKVFDAAFDKAIVGTNLPGAPSTLTAATTSSSSTASANSIMGTGGGGTGGGAGGGMGGSGAGSSTMTSSLDGDIGLGLSTTSKGKGSRKQVISDDEYLTPSDDE